MKKLTITCFSLGLLHAAIMTLFALGPELRAYPNNPV